MPSQYLIGPEVVISQRIHLWEGKSASTQPCESSNASPGSLWTGTLSFSGVMREGLCCDCGNFPKTHLSGSWLSWPRLTKAKSVLVPTFHLWGKKLAVSFGSYSSTRWFDVAQEYRLSRQEMFYCNHSWQLKSPTYRLGSGNVRMATGVNRERGSL